MDVIYPKELEIKDTTGSPKWANYLDHVEFDEDGTRFTRLYDKRDDFDFPIVNFPFLSSNNPESPAYGVFCFSLYVMLRFVRNMKILCSEDPFWFQRRDILHGNFILLFRKFYGRRTDLVHKFDTSLSHMLNGLFTNCDI